MEEALADLPDSEDRFVAQMLPTLDDHRWIPAEYGL